MDSYIYKERKKYTEDQLTIMKDSGNMKLLIQTLLNKYNNDSTNTVTISNMEITKLGLQINYRVLLINAFDKLNYAKNKAKMKDTINSFLIKDIKTYYINKYIENSSLNNEFDEDDNIEVELKYKMKNSTNIDYSYNYAVINILDKIKKYLKMDIINQGTSELTQTQVINIKFKVLTYQLDENDKQVVNDKITKLYKILFTELLNTNDGDNILKKIDIPNNETYITNICVWKSGLCLDTSDIQIEKNCSVPNNKNTFLNTYVFEPIFSGSDSVKSDKQRLISTNKIKIKNTIRTNIKNKLTPKFQDCNNFDIDYDIEDKNEFTLNLYDTIEHKNNNHFLTQIYPTQATAAQEAQEAGATQDQIDAAPKAPNLTVELQPLKIDLSEKNVLKHKLLNKKITNITQFSDNS
jgi:hypothetical protein